METQQRAEIALSPSEILMSDIAELKTESLLEVTNYYDENPDELSSELVPRIEGFRQEMLRRESNSLELSTGIAKVLAEIPDETITQHMEMGPAEFIPGERFLGVTNEKGDKKNLAEIFVLAAFLAYDLAHGGRSLDVLCQEGSNFVMVALGVDPKYLSSRLDEFSTDMTRQLIEKVSTKQLVEILSKMKGKEIYRFLENMDKDDRKKMLAGEKFGGLWGNHQLEQSEIDEIYKKMREDGVSDQNLKQIDLAYPPVTQT